MFLRNKPRPYNDSALAHKTMCVKYDDVITPLHHVQWNSFQDVDCWYFVDHEKGSMPFIEQNLRLRSISNSFASIHRHWNLCTLNQQLSRKRDTTRHGNQSPFISLYFTWPQWLLHYVLSRRVFRAARSGCRSIWPIRFNCQWPVYTVSQRQCCDVGSDITLDRFRIWY